MVTMEGPFNFFKKIKNFNKKWVLGDHFRSKFAPNLNFSQSRKGFAFGRVLTKFTF